MCASPGASLSARSNCATASGIFPCKASALPSNAYAPASFGAIAIAAPASCSAVNQIAIVEQRGREILTDERPASDRARRPDETLRRPRRIGSPPPARCPAGSRRPPEALWLRRHPASSRASDEAHRSPAAIFAGRQVPAPRCAAPTGFPLAMGIRRRDPAARESPRQTSSG